jgi:hypothetical protein
MVRLLYASWPDRPLRSQGRSQDGKGAVWGGLSLQSLLNMGHGCTRSTRGGDVVRRDAETVL